MVWEGRPGVDIEGNEGGRGIVGAEIEVSVTPPAVAVENRRGRELPLLVQLSPSKTEVGAPPYAIGVKNRREEGQSAVTIENEREEGVGAKEVPPVKHHVLSS